MNISRRCFLQTVSAGIAVTTLPISVAVATPEIIRKGDWFLNSLTNKISYTGNAPISVLEMHRAVSTLFEEPELITENLPCYRLTDNMIDFDDKWSLADDTFEHLSHGSVKNGEDLWLGINVLGHPEKGYNIHRDDYSSKRVFSKRDSQLLKIEHDVGSIVITAGPGQEPYWFATDVLNSAVLRPPGIIALPFMPTINHY